MADWLEILLLAVASAFWPTLILIVVLALRLEHPLKTLLFFVAAGFLTTISIGIAIVFALQGTSVVSGSSHSINAGIYLVAGALSLVVAAALHARGTRQSARRPPKKKGPSLAERSVNHGAPLAFAAGVLLNVFPGTFPFVGLVDIAKLDSGTAAKVGAVVTFYVIMFAFAELPIVGYLVAPARTIAAVNEFNDWLSRNGRRIASITLAVVGTYLIVRGLVTL